MNEIQLKNLELKTFTEQDVLDYCQINNLNSDKITILNLFNNNLTDISGIRLFKNLEILYLGYNEIKDISVLRDLNKLKELYLGTNNIKDISVIEYLKKLKYLSIIDLELESDQFKYINFCKNLEKLYCRNGFKDMNVLNQFNKNIINIFV